MIDDVVVMLDDDEVDDELDKDDVIIVLIVDETDEIESVVVWVESVYGMLDDEEDLVIIKDILHVDDVDDDEM